jgi:hypothetical protein
MLLADVSRSAAYLGEVLQEFLALYPDGKLLFDDEKVAESLTDVVGRCGPGLRHLRATDLLNWEGHEHERPARFFSAVGRRAAQR